MESHLVVSSDKPIKIVKWKVKCGSRTYKNTLIMTYKEKSGENLSETLYKFKAAEVGTIKKLYYGETDTVPPGETVALFQGCLHPTVMKQMCAECGADLKEEAEKPKEVKGPAEVASVAMVHSIPELMVSTKEAREIGEEDKHRLLKERKLVLVVDLDQTMLHTTNDNIHPNLQDVYHFQLPNHNQWYHTKFRPNAEKFLQTMSELYELHICTFGIRVYAHTIARFLDPSGKYFSHRILSRDECFSSNSKTANLKALFPCGDSMVCIIDDREDVWNFCPNLIHVKPYIFFDGTADINAPPGADKSTEGRKSPKRAVKIHRIPRSRSPPPPVGPEDELKNVENSRTMDEKKVESTTPMEVDEQKSGSDDTVRNNVLEGSGDTSEPGKEMERETTSEVISKEEKTEKHADTAESKPVVGSSTETKTDSNAETKIEVTNEAESTTKEDDSVAVSKPDSTIASDASEAMVTSSVDDKISPDPGQNATEEPMDQSEHKDKINEKTGEEINQPGEESSEKSSSEINEKPGEEITKKPDEETGVVVKNNIKTTEDKAEVKSNDVQKAETKEEQTSVKDKDNSADDGHKDTSDAKEADSTLKPENDATGDTIVDGQTVEIAEKCNGAPGDAPPSEEYDEIIEWEDTDDYLHYLEDILTKIHSAFYTMLDQTKESGDGKKQFPDLRQIIPYVKRKVLKGTNIVFSGVFPRNQPAEKSRAYMVAKSLGACIQTDIVKPGGDDGTTHLIAARLGTSKVNAAKKNKSLHVVTPDWLWTCNNRWEHVDERLFQLTEETQILQRDSPEVSRQKTKQREKPSKSNSANGEPKVKTSASQGDADVDIDNPEPSTSQPKPQQISRQRFSDTYNPLYTFSSDDLDSMDKEVEDILEESSDSESSEDEMRRIVLGKRAAESSSEESLSGDTPRGWKRKKRKIDNDEDDKETPEEQAEEEFPVAALAENPHRIMKFDDESSSSGSDKEDFNDSIGSVDEEMAAAVEEFLT